MNELCLDHNGAARVPNGLVMKTPPTSKRVIETQRNLTVSTLCSGLEFLSFYLLENTRMPPVFHSQQNPRKVFGSEWVCVYARACVQSERKQSADHLQELRHWRKTECENVWRDNATCFPSLNKSFRHSSMLREEPEARAPWVRRPPRTCKTAHMHEVRRIVKPSSLSGIFPWVFHLMNSEAVSASRGSCFVEINFQWPRAFLFILRGSGTTCTYKNCPVLKSILASV